MSKVHCPGCDRKIGLSESHYGRKLKCKCGQVFRAPEKPAMQSQPVSASQSPIQFSCPTCMTLLQVGAEQAGQLSACPCGAHVQVPAAGDPLGLPPSDPFGFPASNQAGMQPLVSSSALLSSIPPPSQSPYHPPSASAGKRKKKKRKKAPPSSNENTIFEGEVIGGIAMMLGAIVWFVVGLACGYIFFYPPILFLIGLGSLIKGLLD